MTDQELALELRRMYRQAQCREATCQVHLFGIRYAQELQTCGTPLKDIVKLSGISPGYISEISKGIRLAKYVRLREEVDSRD